jgi:RNA polymerase-interacting CarD/CdnL/TRCF family regulator
MDSNVPYSNGDWIVHSNYGVGQIKRIEIKPIHGEETQCYEVKTKDSTYWFPTSEADNPRIRPVASKEIIQKVIKNLRRKPSNLDKDRPYWKKRIEEVQNDSDLLSISKLVRDLSGQQVIRTLNQTEENALEHFKEGLVREWASSIHEEVEKIRPLLYAYIQESKAKVKVD